MKSRITIDLAIFNSILKELKGVRKELRELKGEPVKRPLAPRQLKDAIYTNDVLKILKVSPATLGSYEKKGLIKFHREGRSKVFSEAEVLAFKKSRGRKKRLTKNVIRSRFTS